MDPILTGLSQPGLERSCKAASHDWIRLAPSQPGIERLEAFFSGHAYDSHQHDCYALGITFAGVQSFDYRGARADSQAGNVIVLHPDEKHNGRAGASGGFLYRMLYLEPRLIRDALGDRARSLPFVRTVVTHQPELLQALRPALDDLGRTLDPLEIDDVVVTIAEALLALDPSAACGRVAPACAVAVEAARQYLDAYADETIASSQLEQLTGLDRFSLARHFRALLGTSPYRYLMMRRLDRVRAAIRRGETLADAALTAGFADQSHMTRQFRKAYGVSPGHWRALYASVLS